jgi:methylmalonyl-CoA/ethylmalonyl-CoA epimerase
MSAGFELDHVAVGVPSIAEASRFVVGELGGREHGSGPGIGFRFFQWEFAGGGRLEVLEPAGEPGGFLHRFLERRGPGVHHVTFKVPKLEDAAEHARARGYDIVGWFDADPSWKECFLHPKQAQGIVVQLAEENPSEPDDEPADWPRVELPPRPADAPEPVTLRALRLAARDADAARRQWETTLGGRPRARAEGVTEYRWDGSPLRIVVETRPGADEGPLCVEVATARDWPAGGREGLGTRFVRVG